MIVDALHHQHFSNKRFLEFPWMVCPVTYVTIDTSIRTSLSSFASSVWHFVIRCRKQLHIWCFWLLTNSCDGYYFTIGTTIRTSLFNCALSVWHQYSHLPVEVYKPLHYFTDQYFFPQTGKWSLFRLIRTWQSDQFSFCLSFYDDFQKSYNAFRFTHFLWLCKSRKMRCLLTFSVWRLI